MQNIDFSLYIQAALYALAGINHIVNPRFYLKIMPKWIPRPKQVNILVGIIEFALGMLLILPASQSLAAWGIIALLLAVFPANIYHFQKVQQKRNTLWTAITALRLPLQGLLIYWAYIYT
jgi:uncharacterized membrane protein